MDRYPHWIVATTPDESAAGVPAGDSGWGEATPGDPLPPRTLLDGACNVQDVGQVVPRMASGLPDARADATVFLKDKSGVFDVPVNAAVAVTLNPHRDPSEDALVMTGSVLYPRQLDGALVCRFLDAG